MDLFGRKQRRQRAWREMEYRATVEENKTLRERELRNKQEQSRAMALLKPPAFDCPKCGAGHMGSPLYMRPEGNLRKTCPSCGYTELHAALDAQKARAEAEAVLRKRAVEIAIEDLGASLSVLRGYDAGAPVIQAELLKQNWGLWQQMNELRDSKESPLAAMQRKMENLQADVESSDWWKAELEKPGAIVMMNSLGFWSRLNPCNWRKS